MHKTRGARNFPALLQILRDQLGQRVYPVHRLDNGTSGCLTFSLLDQYTASFQKSLQTEKTQKKYIALVLGKPPSQGFFDRELTADNGIKKAALTNYKVLKYYKDYSLLELELKTGRRNQIRRHLSFVGHHIVGDVKFGKGWLNRKFRSEFNFHRLWLHCHFLSFTHPYTNQEVTIECPLSEDMSQLLKKIDDL